MPARTSAAASARVGTLARRVAAAGASAGVVALAACGAGEQAAVSAAPPLSSRVALSGTIPRPTARDFAGPIAAYKRHVRAQLTRMQADVARMQRAEEAADLAGAQSAWLDADRRYESIGAAYGAFGSLDAAINGGSGSLRGGERSPDFTGLHRVELALWERRDTHDALAPTARLSRDVVRLRAHVASARIEPLDYALRAHEVFEDSLHLQLSGARNRYSGAALTALAGNVAGTRVVFGSLEGMLRRRNAAATRQGAAAIDRLERALRSVDAHGRYPRWFALDQRDRERIAGLTAAAAERLAVVPAMLDPRAPLPPKSAFGQEVSR